MKESLQAASVPERATSDVERICVRDSRILADGARKVVTVAPPGTEVLDDAFDGLFAADVAKPEGTEKAVR